MVVELWYGTGKGDVAIQVETEVRALSLLVGTDVVVSDRYSWLEDGYFVGFIAIAGHLISDPANGNFSSLHACVHRRSREVLLNESCRKACRNPAQLDRGNTCQWLEKP